MPTVRVSMVVKSPTGLFHDVVTHIAGCRDEQHARERARSLYAVDRIKTVAEVGQGEDKRVRRIAATASDF